MAEWALDEQFLDFYVEKYGGGDVLQKSLRFFCGTEEYSPARIAEEMRQGTEFGRAWYEEAYTTCKQEFEQYLTERNKE